MRLITWNINSVRARLHLVEQLLEETNPDVLCLQEIKCLADQFPAKALAKLGYTHQAIRGYKGYHGVATISKIPLNNIETQMHSDIDDGRHIACQVEGPGNTAIEIDNYYIPAGGDIPDRDTNPKFGHKLDYIAEMETHFGSEKRGSHRILVGDLNVAPHENDVWSHKQLLKVVSHTPVEVEAFTKMQNALPWVDGVRHLVPFEEKLFSWWSYRAKDWRASNRGRRLDHVWITDALKDNLKEIKVLDHTRDWEKCSDHVPIQADFVF